MEFWPLVIPEQKELSPLKDMAQEMISSSASLEGRVAPATAKVLGDNLRLLNSYYRCGPCFHRLDAIPSNAP